MKTTIITYPPGIIQQHDELVELARMINAEHTAVAKAVRRSLEHAHQAGLFLREAKKRCRQGEWEQWVKENCQFTPRTARRYLKIARRWSELEQYTNVQKTDTCVRFAICAENGHDTFGVREALEYLERKDHEQESQTAETPAATPQTDTNDEPKVTTPRLEETPLPPKKQAAGIIRDLLGISDFLAELMEKGDSEDLANTQKLIRDHCKLLRDCLRKLS
ncbi:MAG: DUF3102 domain-containing protein [Patescibacteria group bacterium]|nr:DUF3102 domain-containing protein [Patescibacteria group bacterium]